MISGNINSSLSGERSNDTRTNTPPQDDVSAFAAVAQQRQEAANNPPNNNGFAGRPIPLLPDIGEDTGRVPLRPRPLPGSNANQNPLQFLGLNNAANGTTTPPAGRRNADSGQENRNILQQPHRRPGDAIITPGGTFDPMGRHNSVVAISDAEVAQFGIPEMPNDQDARQEMGAQPNQLRMRAAFRPGLRNQPVNQQPDNRNRQPDQNIYHTPPTTTPRTPT